MAHRATGTCATDDTENTVQQMHGGTQAVKPVYVFLVFRAAAATL